MLYPRGDVKKKSGRHNMLNPRGDVKKKEQEALYAIPPRRLKVEGAGDSTCYSPGDT
jgi:hypothetical protein